MVSVLRKDQNESKKYKRINLFIYCLFNDAFRRSYYIASNKMIVKSIKRGRKQSWPSLRCDFGIFMDRLNKTTKTSVQSVSGPRFEF